MIQILHTADWHLGQSFFGYERDEEHEAFLTWLIRLISEEEIDALLISGDIFDVANPSAASQRRFFRFLKEVNRRNPHLQIILTAGNHDSAARLEAPVPLLEELNTHIVGIVPKDEAKQVNFASLLLPIYNKEMKREAWCMAVPFLRQGDYPQAEENASEEVDTYLSGVRRMYSRLYEYAVSRKENGEAILAMGHLHASGAELSDDDRSERTIMGGLESLPASAFPEGIAYVALGHIHKAQCVAGKEHIRYSGSPLPMSFSETNYRHQVVLISIDDGKLHDIKTIPVPLWAELKRVPSKPLPPDEVLQALHGLPEAEDGSDKSRWPYVEVQVLLHEPAPAFRHKVEEALQHKAVRLTSILPSYPQAEQDKAEKQPLTFEGLQKLNPLDMLKRSYENKYHTEISEDLETLFTDVMREAYENRSN